MTTKPKSNRNLPIYLLVAVGGLVCLLSPLLGTAWSACSSMWPANNCGSVQTFGCLLATRTVPCRGSIRNSTERVCNPTFQEYVNANQYECRIDDPPAGVVCAETAANCGYMVTGPCVPSGQISCTLRRPFSPGGVGLFPGMTYSFTQNSSRLMAARNPLRYQGGKLRPTRQTQVAHLRPLQRLRTRNRVALD